MSTSLCVTVSPRSVALSGGCQKRVRWDPLKILSTSLFSLCLLVLPALWCNVQQSGSPAPGNTRDETHNNT